MGGDGRRYWFMDRNDEDEDTAKKNQNHLKEEIRKTKQEAEKRAQLIDADDSDELRSVWSGSDEDKTLRSGSECNDDDDIPTKPFPNEQSDAYFEKLFEFEETPKYRTIAEIYKDEEREELSPGKQARKVVVENALKKLKKGPDGRYINVWELYIGSRTHELPTESNIERLELDVSSDESVASAVSSVIAKCGKIDIVINNAGSVVGKVATPSAGSYSTSLKKVADKEWKLYSEFKEAIAERANASQTDKSSEATLFAKHVAKKVLSSSPPREIVFGHMTTSFGLLY
ncbi:hypothetical protein GIB67_015664, partial [Kingdonia uniflora]